MMDGIQPLPGVMEQLHALVAHPLFDDHVMCGLVTGNVEGIARKKMRSCGIWGTKVLSRKAVDQQHWEGEEVAAFLGGLYLSLLLSPLSSFMSRVTNNNLLILDFLFVIGFGSDYCSGNLIDETRIYKDRGEQIVIAYRRAQSLLLPDQVIARVVHVGDAPGDVLAAKYCSDENKFGHDVVVSCVGVATGKFSAEILSGLFGDVIPGKWEPVCLPLGIADPSFVEVLKIRK